MYVISNLLPFDDKYLCSVGNTAGGVFTPGSVNDIVRVVFWNVLQGAYIGQLFLLNIKIYKATYSNFTNLKNKSQAIGRKKPEDT